MQPLFGGATIPQQMFQPTVSRVRKLCVTAQEESGEYNHALPPYHVFFEKWVGRFCFTNPPLGTEYGVRSTGVDGFTTPAKPHITVDLNTTSEKLPFPVLGKLKSGILFAVSVRGDCQFYLLL